ncbi:dTDP-4-amino-4,6-dideoxygalactose transaminase [Pseudarthrobacter sp. W1I19]|uniref:DegT/DnrJ/EryC1/StrS family aminotransferase n=1 Tax=Pseudarthrobacter sp. W1I19 TaxID=3042288 RepID=UPI0027884939|nr:DegT/DnrJ/EryC1/StrS family aminotransferase [Pseudarthrobacter sp. W1I19]MDQ0925757.1 dTDP-4-amino-4,6-dideoxygalactose transaminase [Pseudarthrobacter sp. W1I19]
MSADVDFRAAVGPVPLVDLAAQQAEVHEEVMAELADVFKRASFIGGPAVAQFEEAYASFLGARHCIGVANGTDALELALRAGGVTPGGEVILPANTFIATAEAVSRIGAVPVPVDVDPEYLLISPPAVAAAVTSRTQAIVPVHLFGQTAFVEQLVPIAEACGAVIVEDAAQSQGATRFGRGAGTFGLAAGTSFYPGKNLGAAGDAGAVLTDDSSVAARVRMLGAHGSLEKYRHDAVGMNSRLDTVQAVVLKAKLARLESWNLRRRAAAGRYTELLADVPGVVVPREAHGNVDVWHLFVVRVPDRDAVLAALHAAGVQAGVHYPVPVHVSGAYAECGFPQGSFPVAEEAAGCILSLPLYPHITAEQQERVVEELLCALTKP